MIHMNLHPLDNHIDNHIDSHMGYQIDNQDDIQLIGNCKNHNIGLYSDLSIVEMIPK